MCVRERGRECARSKDSGKMVGLQNSIIGFICLYIRSLLPLFYVSFASILGLFCLYFMSPLPLY